MQTGKYSRTHYVLQSGILILLLMALNRSYSQDSNGNAIEIFGQLTSDLGSVNNAEIKIKEDDKNWLNVKFNKRTGEFNLALPLGHRFLFSFSQEGTIAKQISFNTRVEELYKNVEFDPFFFMVHLNDYTSTPELDTLFYREPVGKIYFSEEFVKFDYDREYNLYVRNKIARVKEEIELRQQMLAQRKEARRLDSIAKAQAVLIEEPVADATTSLQTGKGLQIPDSVENEPALTAEDTLISPVLADVKEDTLEQMVASTEGVPDVLEETVVEEAPVVEQPEKPIESERVAEEESVEVVEPLEEEKAEIKQPVAVVPTQSQAQKAPEPKPVNIGRKNGNEYEFHEYDNMQVTKIYVTKSRKTIIYSMYQYSDGKTKYYKQQPLTNDSLQINRQVFTQSIR